MFAYHRKTRAGRHLALEHTALTLDEKVLRCAKFFRSRLRYPLTRSMLPPPRAPSSKPAPSLPLRPLGPQGRETLTRDWSRLRSPSPRTRLLAYPSRIYHVFKAHPSRSRLPFLVLTNTSGRRIILLEPILSTPQAQSMQKAELRTAWHPQSAADQEFLSSHEAQQAVCARTPRNQTCASAHACIPVVDSIPYSNSEASGCGKPQDAKTNSPWIHARRHRPSAPALLHIVLVLGGTPSPGMPKVFLCFSRSFIYLGIKASKLAFSHSGGSRLLGWVL